MIEDLTYDQCVAQGIGPLVFPQRLESGEDAANSQRMKAVCLHNIQEQVKLQYTLEHAWHAMENAGIKPVLIKGAGLAALYPEPSMRQWGDIDIFVGKEQYHPACAVMRDTFPRALKFDEELDHYKHYNLIADGVAIEVHRISAALSHPEDNRLYEAIEQYGMYHAEEIETGGLTVMVPESTFNALFVFLHSWEHMISGSANLRQLYDLKLLLEKKACCINQTLLEKWLRSLCLTEVWQVYMYILVHDLDLDVAKAPFYTETVAARAGRMLSDILDGRSAGHAPEKKKYSNRFVRKWHTMRVRLRETKRIERYSPSYARHMREAVILSGLGRLFAKDRRWE